MALSFSGGSNSSIQVRNTTEIKVIKCKITLDSFHCKKIKYSLQLNLQKLFSQEQQVIFSLSFIL